MDKHRRDRKLPLKMKTKRVLQKLRMLVNWDHQCVICGHSFVNIRCVTVEHVIPQSLWDHSDLRTQLTNNILAPSHWRCNQLRGVGSLLETSIVIAAIESGMSPTRFRAWLNYAPDVADDCVPWYFKLNASSSQTFAPRGPIWDGLC